MSVNKKYLYLYNSTDIWRIDKTTGDNLMHIAKTLADEKILGMKVFNASRIHDLGENECDRSYCKHFCYARPLKTCGCMDDYQLKNNGFCEKSIY